MISTTFRTERRFTLAATIALSLLTLPAFAANLPGVNNFYQVNEHVFRGAQPTAEGFQSLAKLGIKTVIDLRESGSRSVEEAKEVKAAGLKYINIPLKGMEAPSGEDVAKILALFNSDSAGPVFVHCRRGADRTGTMVACYRISHDGWNNQKALHEAKSCGMSWIERAMQHYVLSYKAPVNYAAVPAATTQAATTAAGNNQ